MKKCWNWRNCNKPIWKLFCFVVRKKSFFSLSLSRFVFNRYQEKMLESDKRNRIGINQKQQKKRRRTTNRNTKQEEQIIMRMWRINVCVDGLTIHGNINRIASVKQFKMFSFAIHFMYVASCICAITSVSTCNKHTRDAPNIADVSLPIASVGEMKSNCSD